MLAKARDRPSVARRVRFIARKTVRMEYFSTITQSGSQGTISHMSTILPRKPEIDWSKDFDPHWLFGNRFLSHLFNALSFMLPVGEQYFHESAREVAKNIDLSINPQLSQDVRDFTVQESMHAAQHRHYNDALARHGYNNIVVPSMIWWKTAVTRCFSPITNLAIVCAYEHYTAILAEQMLDAPPEWFESSPSMALLWGWHAAEETEHKAVCFDLYVAAGGGWLRRVAMFFVASILFNFVFLLRTYVYLVRKDRPQRPHQPGAGVSFGEVVRALRGPAGSAISALFQYLRPSFHPWQRDNRPAMEAWLRANEGRLRFVRSSVGKSKSPSA